MAGKTSLSGSLTKNRKVLRQTFGGQAGIVFRELSLPGGVLRPIPAFLVYAEGAVDDARLEAHLIAPLLAGEMSGLLPGASGLTPRSRPIDTIESATGALARGMVLFQCGRNPLHAFELGEVPFRPIGPPRSETSIHGPQEAFNENLNSNLTMLRRRLPDPALRLESLWAGRAAPGAVVVAHHGRGPPPPGPVGGAGGGGGDAPGEGGGAYLAGGPTRRMVKEVRRRLGKVDQSHLQGTAELAEALSGPRLSLFPKVLPSERPDLVAQFLRAGRIALLLENGPRAMILPALFMDFLTSPDDYYEWRPIVLFLRLLRLLAFVIAVPLPALYISVTTYHLQALPTQLTLSLLAQREGAPLPAPVEALLMTVIFEILVEAGVRLPRVIGATVSIVGGLVIGEAAIRSGITSPAMVLVVSATAVSAFTLPSTTLAAAATYMRFTLLLLAGAFGFFGLLLGYLFGLAMMAGMTSLGVPYMAPLYPLQLRHAVAAVGGKPRPPLGGGTTPAPGLVREADRFQDRDG